MYRQGLPLQDIGELSSYHERYGQQPKIFTVRPFQQRCADPALWRLSLVHLLQIFAGICCLPYEAVVRET